MAIVLSINKGLLLEKENESIKFYNYKINTFTKINNYKKCIICKEENALNVIVMKNYFHVVYVKFLNQKNNFIEFLQIKNQYE